jgi:MATE family multidrug resistance protein
MIGLEAWGFEAVSVMAARLGPEIFAAHTIQMAITGFMYLSFPMGISIAASIRIGNLLGANRPQQARIAGIISVIAGSGFMLLCGIMLYTLRWKLPLIFTTDAEAIAIAASLAPIAAAFQVVDGCQGVCQGVLRGMARQALTAKVQFFAFWCVGLPLGAVLCFYVNIGIYGLWWGFLLSLTAGSITFLIILRHTDWEQAAKAAVGVHSKSPTAAVAERSGESDPLLV